MMVQIGDAVLSHPSGLAPRRAVTLHVKGYVAVNCLNPRLAVYGVPREIMASADLLRPPAAIL